MTRRGNPGHDERLKHKMRCPADVTIKELHPQKQDPLHVKQEESETPCIKQEAEPETPSIKEEHEDEIPKFPMTVSVKSEDDEGPKPLSDSSFQHLTTKGEGRSQHDDITVENLHPKKHDPPHVKQEESDMAYIKQEAEPETSSIKEEPQEEEIQFPMNVSVKSEEDEGPSKESSNLFQHLTTKGEGRSPPDDLLRPLSESDAITSRSSDFNADEEDVDFQQNALKSLNKSALKGDAKKCAGGEPFSCSRCDKKFATKEYLIIHTHTHTRGKPFICTFCGKAFTQKGSLNIHIRIHTGVKPFVCSLCDKRFSRKQSLTKHTRTHTGEKRFVCSLCDESFCTKHQLNRHSWTHTGEKPFFCSLCNKRFCAQQDLKRHMRTHTGEKPFVCTFCGKKFTQQGHLTTHTRGRAFVCPFCDQRFCGKRELTRHMHIHTELKVLPEARVKLLPLNTTRKNRPLAPCTVKTFS
ncbi:oocyte zinc finger protein XlCOF7.1-like isoform X2 [Corythoichthys intestinalis]|uniref:oocyte zinc finger protein XlCOF7.1-like isoform X2 n=1 Tax=Corythoichthys intestinalis TaxID=161448 RepID=UPI0025A65D9C|nr:oocyte zinc finger protein XlCOF7.1-like isoform X2 [Corythoichthys intestinalis]